MLSCFKMRVEPTAHPEKIADDHCIISNIKTFVRIPQTRSLFLLFNLTAKIWKIIHHQFVNEKNKQEGPVSSQQSRIKARGIGEKVIIKLNDCFLWLRCFVNSSELCSARNANVLIFQAKQLSKLIRQNQFILSWRLQVVVWGRGMEGYWSATKKHFQNEIDANFI